MWRPTQRFPGSSATEPRRLQRWARRRAKERKFFARRKGRARWADRSAHGTTIRQIVEEMGGGVAEGRRFKAVQIGGPSGGCVPAELADTPVDYEALVSAGAIMGSGGMVVLDDTDCMVDIARYFLEFSAKESCGQCTMCRIGTRRLQEILDRLCTGKGRRRRHREAGRAVGDGQGRQPVRTGPVRSQSYPDDDSLLPGRVRRTYRGALSRRTLQDAGPLSRHR